MKYKLRAEVEGTLFLEAPNAKVQALRDNYAFELESDASGRVVAASVTTTVRATIEAEFYSTFDTESSGNANVHIQVGEKREFH